MSRIYFHNQFAETAELRGSERAYAGVYCSNQLAVALDLMPDPFLSPGDQHWLTPWLPSRFRREYGGHQIESIRMGLAVGFRDSDITLPDGREIHAFSLGLNTAYRGGSDPVRLLARLHGQCELHCWVDGPNRAWLAGIIRDGARSRILRRAQGWDDVVTLLESASDSPVVCSYSVCESFPNLEMGQLGGWSLPQDEDGEADWDAWHELGEAEQWDFAMRGLREEGGRLELCPDDWDGFTFGAGVSAWDLQDLREA
jgi:hypothetical protein